jgi:hypothetical protein
MTKKSQWIPEDQPSRTADGAGIVGRFNNERGCRVEVTIAFVRLAEFGEVKDTLDARKERARLALRAVLEQVDARDPKKLKRGSITRISDKDVDVPEIRKSLREELQLLGIHKEGTI